MSNYTITLTRQSLNNSSSSYLGTDGVMCIIEGKGINPHSNMGGIFFGREREVLQYELLIARVVLGYASLRKVFLIMQLVHSEVCFLK